MLRVPICFCAISRVQKIFYCETVQLLLLAEHSDNIPAQSVDRVPIDRSTRLVLIKYRVAQWRILPSAGDPALARLGEEIFQCRVCKLVFLYAICGEIYNRDL